ncbi:aminomethyl-transferring glycine dehydrogenase subunit GcvPB [Youngiibacter multivorans]|uniref:Probable glycine dehydrogenase (decarboxylating) subunit 2 n=1 Tax=Youngiibacter multivorans TaxID=937251 RepID=A0ABS4G0N2_9CLOT|nr:aminomethyl-transferring glycine dehydrogenase subunit GcvPB [Youngiibacter multivorans]MBP1918108.1 glycine dehydrogenase subunit 2 [Youngiibacter multivorans]
MAYEKMIFELSKKGRKAYSLPPLDVDDLDVSEYLPEGYVRKDELEFPEVSELDLVRHYTLLSKKNYSIDSGFYPLGSCTMKYNPKINEDMAANPKFARLHPLQEESTVQGALEVMFRTQEALKEITGMDAFTLQPAAGAHGELTGLMIIKKYHEVRNDSKRRKIIVPDSAHGTNPASVTVAGFEAVEIPSMKDGSVSIEALKAVLDDETAGLMLTNPSTLGLFEKNIMELADLVHAAGGLLYYDGANMNAIMGIARPGDMGFDVLHLNLHKTFSTPHGGGGPGSGPVGVKAHLACHLPVPVVSSKNDNYYLDYGIDQTIGRIKNFFGNFGVVLRAYSYILSMGSDGLKEASTSAVLNANYIKERLKDDYKVAIDETCMHEVVFAGIKDKDTGVTTLEIAKRLIDYGFHPPTIYFPLIVDSAIMVEPTETESMETMDEFIAAMKNIAREAREEPELLHSAPHISPVRRLDEVKAARSPKLKWKREE